MGRNRDSSLVAAHVAVRAGRDADGALRRSRWYAPNFRKYWVTPVWHFRQASGATGQWKNWYATEWTGAEPDRQRGAVALGRARATRPSPFATRSTPRPCRLPVLDAAAANLSILKSPTTLRLEDGTFYGWEGCHPNAGSCEGSCTHVWNYQQALPFLFPALERSMREADYAYNMDDAGGLSFRLSLPLGTHNTTERPCADGQFGNVLKLYRDWKLSGDIDWLRRLWPRAKKSIEYAWSPDNRDRWDPEQTGVLWGRQHHTLDMELFGPNSWLTGFYLGALKAGAEMAEALGETEHAPRSTASIYERGRAWVDDNLFNGEYFIQKIDLGDRSVLAPFADDRGRRGAARRRRRAALLERRAQAAQVPARRRLPHRPGARPVAREPLRPRRRSSIPTRSMPSLQAIYRHNFVTSARRHLQSVPRLRPLRRGRHRHRHLAGRRRASPRSRCPTRRRRCTAWSTPSARC